MLKRIVYKIYDMVFRRHRDIAGNPLILKINKRTKKEDALEELKTLRKNWAETHKRCYPQAHIEIGDYTYGFPKVKHWPGNSTLKIGKFCSFAEGVTILLGGEHAVNWITTYPFYGMLHAFKDRRGDYVKNGQRLLLGTDVVIGNDVWVGTDAAIMSGVVAGNGCVIGANALVTRNRQLPPYTIWGGNPAKQIGVRFPPETVEQLETLKWWDWSDEDICGAIPFLLSDDIVSLAAYYQRKAAGRGDI
jgi:acetyltransferase-like isoleucine patch superfamily enzyme